MTRRRGGRVTDGGFGLPDRLVQLVDEVFEVLQAAFADLSEVFPERNLQLLLQVGVFSHQHFHHHPKCLTVLTVHLKKDRRIHNFIQNPLVGPLRGQTL